MAPVDWKVRAHTAEAALKKLQDEQKNEADTRRPADLQEAKRMLESLRDDPAGSSNAARTAAKVLELLALGGVP